MLKNTQIGCIAMTKDEAMRLALDAYNKFDYSRFPTVKTLEAAMLALRTALAQPDVQIGITYEKANPSQPYCQRCGKKLGIEVTDIHTCTPLKKEWVGLTDDEVKMCAKGSRSIGIHIHDAIRKAEAKLKEKNCD